MTARQNTAQACPCGGGLYADCCGRFIDGATVPDSAEQLMRSRYSAYVLRNEAYLRSTWHASTRPAEPLLQEGALKWLGLDVRRHEQQGDAALVEFVARYKEGGRAHRLHEVSRFVREQVREKAHWFYVDGSFPKK
jgi:SEC-C motif-containing protein